MAGGLLGLAGASTASGPGAQGAILIVAAVALLVGAAMVLAPDRIPACVHPVLVALATLLVTVMVHWFPSTVATVTPASLYVFIACDAAFIFTTPVAIAETAFAVVCCMVALGTRQGLLWWIGVIPAAVTIVVAVAVGVLARMAADADIDVLTGLLNRRGFDRLVNAEISRAGRSGRRPALVLVDLDRFARINDHLGQRAGDTVLKQVAETWSALVPPGQRLARFGGNVFAVLLPDTTEQAAVGLTERMRASVATGCSAGVTSWQPGESASLLISRADVGLYRAKQAGRNRTVLESSRRLPSADEMRDAIQHNRLDIAYQPIVSLSSGGKAVGVEALLRWSSPVGKEFVPDSVMRMSGERDLVCELDRAVLRKACEDAVRLQGGFADLALTLNINVSGMELVDKDYAGSVEHILETTGWPADRLVLEVTDTHVAAESPDAIANLNQLRSGGVKIAINDFGIDDPPLSRLAAIPGDILKVDSSFVASITSTSPAPALLAIIQAVSKALDMEVVTDGVESRHQAAALTDLGFALAQGYHHGSGQSVADLIDELNGSVGDSVV